MNERQEYDLTWLARNVHEWPAGHQGWCFVTTHASGAKGVAINKLLHPEATKITIDDWLARRAELQNKPSWADAPEWAQWLAQDDTGKWYWYEDKPHHSGRRSWGPSNTIPNNEQCGKGAVLGDWRDTLEHRPDMHKSPEKIDTSAERVQVSAESIHNLVCSACGCKGIHACLGRKVTHADRLQEITEFVAKQQAKEAGNWHERGELPPVGAECVIWSEGRFPPAECKIEAYSMEQVCVRWKANGDLDVIDLQFKNPSECKFRPISPIRTERDVLLELLRTEGVRFNSDELADAILAAGFTKGGAA